MKKVTSKLKKIKKKEGVPISVLSVSGGICLLERLDEKGSSSIFLSWSVNGLDFSTRKEKIYINVSPRKKEKIEDCKNFRVSKTPTGFVMTYLRSSKSKKGNVIVVAKSRDLVEWKVFSEVPALDSKYATVSYDKSLDLFVLYQDGLFIKNTSARTLSSFREKSSLLFTGRNGHFDASDMWVIGSAIVPEGILLLYDASVVHKNKTLIQIGAVIFDIHDPKCIIFRSSDPVWQGIAEAKKEKLKKNPDMVPIGFGSIGEKFFVYWVTLNGNLIVARISKPFKEVDQEFNRPKILNRFKGNPIIEPRGHHDWEGEGTFNPAVVEDDEGTVHLLYRAVGKDGVSRVGYAQSKDGVSFKKRSAVPVFEPLPGFGLPDKMKMTTPAVYNPAIYTSGGGWGGAEDPRLVKIDDTVYMTYVAFEGWNSVRIAMTSISVEDFKNERWTWKKPVLLSPPGKINKNWLLFPEKIHGKFAVLHSIAPRIAIDYIDDLENMEKYIESPRKDGPQPGRRDEWDAVLRGAGPPPLRTELGWLLLYHALEKRDGSKYRLGAMILDKNDPTKILYRSSHPILSPDMHYENHGKPGVVYASGAIIRDDNLYVYYGGADRVVCVATTPLKEFLNYMQTGNAESYQLKKLS